MRLVHCFCGSLLVMIVAASSCWEGSGFYGLTVLAFQDPSESSVLPNKDDSLKFSVLGDFGTGERPQYQLAEQMAKLHDRFKYNLVVLVGDNLYGAERPQDFQKKFEIPYKRYWMLA